MEELKKALDEADQSDGPVLIDCHIGMDEKVLPMIPPGRSVGELMLLAVPLAVIIPTCFNRRESTWLGIAYLLLLVSMIAYNLFPVSL